MRYCGEYSSARMEADKNTGEAMSSAVVSLSRGKESRDPCCETIKEGRPQLGLAASSALRTLSYVVVDARQRRHETERK